VKNTLARISHSVWELNKLIAKRSESFDLRSDFLRFFHEDRIYLERKRGIAEENRSFLLLQNREALSCLLIHGAGGTPAEMRSLGRHLFDAGYTVYGMRLSLNPEAGVSKASRPIWKKFSGRHHDGYHCDRALSDAEIVLRALLTFSPRTYVVGFSFGATIALRLIQRHPARGALLLAPALFPVMRGRFAAFSVLKRVAPFAAKQVSPLEYSLGEFVERSRTHLKAIELPILVVQAARDSVLSSRGVAFLKTLARNPKSKFVLLESARHVIVKGEDSEKVFRLCTDFIRET
jgi:esterase/lipase